ncbi:cell division protein SepF [Atopobacter phocae]|uniref:cell division protein SepF n=1 Tax=Atopobacter phocae TaxID=136492 RepID=UPI0004724C95|nr:cell division protein SepF [Atopobacter phocae]
MGFFDGLKEFIFQPEDDDFEYEEETTWEQEEPVVSNQYEEELVEYQNERQQMPKRSERSSSIERYNSKVPEKKRSGHAVSIIHVVHPRMYLGEVEKIADELLAGQAVIANFEQLPIDEATRIIDYLSGIAYAIDGDVQKIREGIFIATPATLSVEGVLEDESNQERFFSNLS